MQPIDAHQPRAKGPAVEAALSSAAASLAPSLKVADPRNLKPGELLRTINGTPLGTVVTELKLRGHRARAGGRFEREGGKRIDLLAYIAWLAIDGRRKARRDPEGTLTLRELADGAGVSERTLNTWIGRGCPRERGGGEGLAAREHFAAEGRTAEGAPRPTSRRSRCSTGSMRPRRTTPRSRRGPGASSGGCCKSG
jgi:hypothetical protein